MNLKKLLISLTTILIMVVCISSQSIVNAATTSHVPAYYGITELMEDNGLGYAIGDPTSNTEQENKAAKIWNILKYKSDTTSSGYEDVYAYCIKAGVGFTSTVSGPVPQPVAYGVSNVQPRLYNVSYDMKTQREAIKNQNEILKGLVDTQIQVDENTTINRFDAILAVLDMMYVPGESDEQVKTNLINEILEYAMKPENNYTEYVERMQKYPIQDSDIIAIQQAVLWYFTNYGEDGGKYDQTDKTGWLYYTKDGNTYDAFKNYTPNNEQQQNDAGQARSVQAEILYKYMIAEAKSNANKYTKYAQSTQEAQTLAPATLNTHSLQYTTNGDKYIIGPINITEATNNEIPYTIDFVVKNKNENVDYELLDQDKQQVQEEKTIKDLVGNNFYISIPRSSVTELSVDISIKYTNTKMTLIASTSNTQEQPLAIPEKENKNDSETLTLTPTKTFDLALRKYITKIERNGQQITFPTRVPAIEEGTLSTKTTATYKHRKDPITVQTNDKVTYSITIYNEGEKPGRATEIVDQLPTGLKYERVVSGNFVFSSYDEKNGNRLTLVRNAENQNDLPAYTPNSLTSGTGAETIEIECTVTATPDEENKKVLTNIAWISKERDGETGEEITSREGADRDSEPATTPTIKNSAINENNMSDYRGNEQTNKEDLKDSGFYYEGQQDDDDFEKLVILPEAFDLKLIKNITEVNGEEVEPRIKDIDVSKLNTLDEDGNMITTAEYDLDKEPVQVKQGDIVTYTFKIFNEGTIDGYAKEITEDVPKGLEFIWSDKYGEELQNDTSLTPEEKEAIAFNQKYLWKKFIYNETRDKIIQISSDYLSLENEAEKGENLISAFGRNDDGKKTKDDLHYKEISVKFKVIAENVSGPAIRNEAAITDDNIIDENGEEKEKDDRDSKTDEWKKYEDDEDYDNVILKSFDLALRKFIIAVSNDTEIEESEYLKNEDSSYTRAPQVDTSKLNEMGEDGKLITTATYNHTKEPVEVKRNDYVIYMLRVYNEGDTDGYAGEIKDHLPPYLKFVEGEFNTKYGWSISEDGRTATTNYLKNEKIDKAKEIQAQVKELDDTQKYELSYKEVPIMCQVVETAKTDENITNIADITEYLDDKQKEVTDRDSKIKNVELPEDENLPGYKDNETGEYIPGQEDDDDFEKVIVKPFDLALRKFITEVDKKPVDTRIPQVKYDAENNKLSYEHTKEPVRVVTGNTVIYTLRIFNEGAKDGYAAQILDDIPEGLQYLPENETNTQYRWKMYRPVKDDEVFTQQYEEGRFITQDGKKYVITENVEEAEVIVTDYLSKEQGEARMEEDTTITENPNLLKAFKQNEEISDTNPDYKDVKVAFKVIEANSSDRTIVNEAQISKDTDKDGKEIDDDDSVPGEWNDGEDDQDKEYIDLAEFDLSLRKWVTQAIVIENGKETITQTGHQPYDDPEKVVKVEIHRNKLNKVTVKFRYSIRVTNEGDIEGYAKEITDYVPQGLKFVAEDNPGWKDEGNNVISTRLLENTLLKPGEYADVEVLLTWINGSDNMGVMNNTAEISEDYNEPGVPDRDSTPDNKKDGEDDIDDAPVMLSISTGQIRTYFTLGFIILITIAGGVILIKKFVL